MPSIPIRDFAKDGIITDIESYDLPLQSFSFGSNIRITNGKIERGNVFRKVANLDHDTNAMFSFQDGEGAYHLFYSATDGRIYERTQAGVVTDKSPASGMAGVSPGALTTICRLNGVVYWNRSDQVPFYRAETSIGNFSTLTSYNSGNGKTQFSSNYRFRALREVGGVLVGINVTESGVNDPRRVVWSNLAVNKNLPPPDWAVGDSTSSSRSNSIAQFNGYLIDGFKLGTSMILYGNLETWEMSPNGTDTMFNFRRLFSGGVINVNCVVEAQAGKHFVFGNDDIYATDGNSQISLAEGKVRNFIYDGLVRSEANRFFTVWNPKQTEVIFCYVSNDAKVHFKYGPPNNNIGCNRAAIFNYSTGVWYFADLPYVTAATFSPITKVLTIDEMTSGIDTYGGSNDATAVGQVEAFLFSSSAATLPIALDRSLRTYEPDRAGATTANIDLNATAPATIEKSKIDLDELKADLRGYKVVNGLVPQATMSPDAEPIVISVGVSDHPNENTVWLESQTFHDGEYKCDFHAAGRYLAIKIVSEDYRHFTLSGMDFDLIALGSR